MIEHSWSVEGNWDQIKRYKLDEHFIWVHHPKVQNRVKTHLPFDNAKNLYDLMKGMGLVAHKNWE
jgi:hypothetical protein